MPEPAIAQRLVRAKKKIRDARIPYEVPRVLCDLMPDEDENKGLLALMLLQDSRRAARTGAKGELITLEHQNRSLWNRNQILEAQSLLRNDGPGRYAIEARIALAHAAAETPEATDWRNIAKLYQELAELMPSPVIELNRAVAVAMADGFETGLALIDALPGLDAYHLYHAARADLLRRLDRHADAAAAYRRALELVTNPVEREYLDARLNSVEGRMLGQ